LPLGQPPARPCDRLEDGGGGKAWKTSIGPLSADDGLPSGSAAAAEDGGADTKYGGDPHEGGPSGKTLRRPGTGDVASNTVKSEILRAISIDGLGDGFGDGFGDLRVGVHSELNRRSGSDESNRYGDGGHTERRQKDNQPN